MAIASLIIRRDSFAATKRGAEISAITAKGAQAALLRADARTLSLSFGSELAPRFQNVKIAVPPRFRLPLIRLFPRTKARARVTERERERESDSSSFLRSMTSLERSFPSL